MSADPGALAAMLPATMLTASGLNDSIRLRLDAGAARQGRPRSEPTVDWDGLPEALQLTLASAAMRHAAIAIAGQAETLAREMEVGALPDFDGPEALRLLATIVRISGEPGPGAGAAD
jgi:hypothetical protein